MAQSWVLPHMRTGVTLDITSEGSYNGGNLKNTGGTDMKATQIVFSPTGGTQQVIDAVTSAWETHVNKIDLTNPKNGHPALDLSQEDIAAIAVPSYGGRVPALAAERLKRIDGNHARCVVICVYGNRAYEDTLLELRDIAEQRNFNVVAAISAIAEHSILHQYATGRPNQEDKDELRGFAGKVLEKIGSGNADMPGFQIPGNRPYKKAGGVGLVPKATGKCVGCGLCAEKCPAQAISKEKIKGADSKKCISCMRCVVQCPHSARKVNGAMVSAAALALKKACSERKDNELYI